MRSLTVLLVSLFILGSVSRADVICKSYGDYENGQEVHVSALSGTFVNVVIGGKLPTDMGAFQLSTDANDKSDTYVFSNFPPSGLTLTIWRDVPFQMAVSGRKALIGFKGQAKYTARENKSVNAIEYRHLRSRRLRMLRR